MNHFVKILVALLISMTSMFVHGQSFPVQLTPQSIPPNPVYLSDYASTNVITDRLKLQILLNDLTVNNLEVKLKVFIQGEGITAESTNFVIGAAPLFLDGGLPLQLGSIDLAPYFEFQNLQGINPNVYANALPDGIYNFCYEVYDAFTGNRLSDRACASFVLFQNEPPLLSLPLNSSIVEQQDIYNILFQWTPRHVNVSNVQYEFSLVQIFDNYVDPQAAFLASQPIFQTTISETNLLYDMRFPPLTGGYRYAWRVRAFATQGAEEIGVFSNQGHSEIWSFDYIAPCASPINFYEDPINKTSAKINWTGAIEHLDYNISYREQNAGSNWYVLNTPREYITLNALRAGTTYEYKVAGNCDLGGFTYSPIQEFTTLQDEDNDSTYVCNVPPDTVDLSNQDLLSELLVNDLFFANDFPITVLELTSNSPPFSGKGYIGIPWLDLARVGVEFQGIQINTEFKLVQGVVQTTYDADWGDVNFIDDYFDWTEGDNDNVDIIVDFDIDHVDVDLDDGTVTIVGANGEEVEYPIGDDYTIIDGDGDVYHVDEDGNVTDGGEIADGGPIDTDNTGGFDSNGNIEQLSADGIKVIFEASGYYAYDKIPNNQRSALQSQYQTITDTNGESYDIIHKVVANGEDDTLTARIQTNDTNLISRLEFKTADGVEIEYTIENNIATLNLNGHFSFEYEDIYAAIVPEEGSSENQTIAGTFKLWHLSKDDINVTVVPINGASIPSDLQSDLNTIFGPSAINFNVQVDTNLDIDPSVWGNDGIDVGNSGWFAHYTEDQAAIRSEYYQQRGMGDDRYYLFVTDENPSRPVAGFMPLKRQYGFIFNTAQNGSEEAKSTTAAVVAHELGHGVFGLKHPFSEYNTTQSATTWLMDYSNGNALNHMDWKKMHNPDFELYWFQGDDDGGYSDDNVESRINTVLNHIKSVYQGENDILNFKDLVYNKCSYYSHQFGVMPEHCDLKKHYTIPTANGDLKFRLVKQPSVSREDVKISSLNETLKIKKRRILALGSVYDIFYQLILPDTNSDSKFIFEFEHHDDIEAFCKYMGIQGLNVDPGQTIIEEEEDLTAENAQEILDLPEGASVADYYNSIVSNYEDLLEATSEMNNNRSFISIAIVNHLDANYLPSDLGQDVDCNSIDIYFSEIPADHAAYIARDSLWNALMSLLDCNVDQNYADEEAAVVTLIKSLSKPGNETDFLDGIITKTVDDDTVFKRLFRKMDESWFKDDNFTNLMVLLTDIWKRSDYNNPGDYESIPYSNRKEFGFYVSDYRLFFAENFTEVRIQEIVGYVYPPAWSTHQAPPQPIYEDLINPSPSIYQTILLIDKDNIRSDFSVPGGFIPMFLLKALTTKNSSKNWVQAGVLTFDVVTTLTGVGNLAKLRHLRHLKRLGALGTVKVVIGASEVTFGSLGIMLEYSDNCQGESTPEAQERCKKLRTVLLILEIGSLGTDLAINQALKRSADEAINAVENSSGFTNPGDKASILNDLRKISDDVADVLLPALRTKFAGKTEILNWLDEITDSSILSFLDDLPTSSYSKLEEDILALKSHFNGNPTSVRAWNRIRQAAQNANPNAPNAGVVLRKDIPSLKAVAAFDDDLVIKIGRQRFDNFLEKLIKSNPKCSTCGNNGDALVGNLNDVMDDLYVVATQRAVKTDGDFVNGFNAFMSEAGEQATKAKGAALTLRKMAHNWDELTEGSTYVLKRFEGSIPDIETGHKLDILFEKTVDGVPTLKSVEMKNWSEARSVSGGTYQQFKAYIISGKKFEYYFSDGLQQAMKAKFANVFTDPAKALELFEANPNFFRGISDIDELDDLIDLANSGELAELIYWVK